jgi:hypothetical protein
MISEPEIPLDPALFSPVPSLALPSTNVDQAQEPALEDEDFALLTEEEEITARSSKGKKKKKRVYPSIRNPFCGLVDGVGRGDRAASKSSRGFISIIQRLTECIRRRVPSSV